jgi:hypothetical protein
MNTRAALLLSIGTGAAGFFAAWLIFRSDGTCRIDDASSPVEARGLQREAPQLRATPEPPDLERPDSRVPAFTERPPEPTPAPSAPAKPVAAVPASDPSDPRTLPEGSLAEMEVKRDAIQELLVAKQMPFMEERYKDGRFEHLTDDNALKGSAAEYERERHLVYTKRFEHGRGWNLVVLPREEFPDLYAYKDEVVRLDDLMREKRVAEAKTQAQAGPK